jgi:hypothetical protein
VSSNAAETTQGVLGSTKNNGGKPPSTRQCRKREQKVLAPQFFQQPAVWLVAHVKPGDVLYDVEAHIGFISLVAAGLVGPSDRVFAFEADSENASRIAGHAQMNSLS